LGQAIACTNPEGLTYPELSEKLNTQYPNAVVLIDEIDKAPRDFTNDILHEIERYEFSIKELNNTTIQKQKANQVLVINKFEEIREKAPRKKPATAEFIAWLQILQLKGYLEAGNNPTKILQDNLSVLVKTKEDLSAIQTFLKQA